MAERIALAAHVEADCRTGQPERLPVPIAALVILVLSAGLWAGIIWVVRAVLA